MMHKVAVVYYASTRGDWLRRTRRSFDRMISSGLYDAADEIYLVVSDIDGTNQESIDTLGVQYSKCTIERHLTRTDSEHNGIVRVEEIGNRLGQEYRILYMHSKGVMNQYKTVLTEHEPYPIKVKGVATWIDMMEYFLVDKWADCIDKLCEVDTVGVKNYAGWWWGNFWWANSEHIKRLNKPYSTSSRWGCEAWLHDWHPNKEEINFYQWFPFQFNPYYTELPRKFWDNSQKDDISITIRKVEFGCFGEQQDEGRPINTEVTTVDVTDMVLTSFDGQRVNVWDVFNKINQPVCHEPSVRVYYHTQDEPTVEKVATSMHGLFQYITFIRENQI